MTASATPIFVLGIQRSGTTLAANLLAAHPDIAAVSDARHHGVHESVFFSHFARIHGYWSDANARQATVSDFLSSDYFELTGLDSSLVRPLAEASPTAGAFFAAVMDLLARAGGARAWVEKSPHHTLLATEIAAQLPNAVFLCVSRDSEGLLRSRLWSFGRHPPRYPARANRILRVAASNVFHRRHMSELGRQLGQERVFQVSFDALRRDPDAALLPLLEKLRLEPLDGRRPSFAPNSSFATSAQRSQALTPTDLRLVRIAEAIAWRIPQPVLKWLQRRIAARRPVEYPRWVWPPPAGDDTARERRS